MEIYRLKLTIRDSEPKIWRRVEIPYNLSLVSLHKVIQIVMNWDDCHLHAFVSKNVYYGNDSEFGRDYKGMAICDLLPKKGSKVKYIYDFGDNFEVDIVVEKIEERDVKSFKPQCNDGEGDPPLEDCGGIYSYMDLRKALKDKSNGIVSELTEWADDMCFDEDSIIGFNLLYIDEMLSTERFGKIKNPKSRDESCLREDLEKEMIDELFSMQDTAQKKVKPKKYKITNNEEKSNELLLQALECDDDDEIIKLLDEALNLNPNNIDAIFMRGCCCTTLEEAMEIYYRGLNLAEKLFGKKYFKENKGYFWKLPETRTYMRMKDIYAETLYLIGDIDNSIQHLREIIALNPEDNQGVRYALSSRLLEIGNYDEFADLHKEYIEDISASWKFNYALYQFIRTGDSLLARKALRAANKENKYVRSIFKSMDTYEIKEIEDYILGSEDEANYYLTIARNAWIKVPNAIEWIVTVKL